MAVNDVQIVGLYYSLVGNKFYTWDPFCDQVVQFKILNPVEFAQLLPKVVLVPLVMVAVFEIDGAVKVLLDDLKDLAPDAQFLGKVLFSGVLQKARQAVKIE